MELHKDIKRNDIKRKNKKRMKKNVPIKTNNKKIL